MPRRVEDIVRGNHRSIRDIPVEHPSEKKRVSQAHPHKGPHIKKEEESEIKAETKEKVTMRQMPHPHTPRRKKSSGGRWFIMTLGIIVIVAGVAYVASEYFSRATFTIIPKTIPVTVNGTYVAQHASVAASQGTPDALVYETITVRNSASTTVPAADGPTISTKAQGKVTIYNTYGDAQQIIAGSRLANSSGKVYRLTGTITVPAGTANNPGSIVTTVVADQSGQIYNIAKGEKIEDLRFLGYRGSPRYDAFYARPASDISGGYEGKKKTVDSDTLASTTAALKAQLEQTMADRVKAAVPDGYIAYDSMNTTSYSDPVISGKDPTKAEITLSATFNGIIFKKDRLALRFAGVQSINSFGKFAYETPGLESLIMTIANPKDFVPEKKTPLLVRANGEFTVKGAIPVDEIKSKLSGIPLAQTQEILQSYGRVIQSASGELIPPWAKVPNDPERIKVVVEEK